jgi:ADP-ribose pyrophosphatase YjhB (NUDIX family)
MDGVIKVGVCFFLHDGQGKYMIHRRSQLCRDEQGRWDCGGGGVEFGETIEDALRREVHEEFNVIPQEIKFMGYRDVFRGPEASAPHWIVFDFKVKVDPKTVKNNEPDKCDEIRWVTLAEFDALAEPKHSQFPIFLEKNRSFL